MTLREQAIANGLIVPMLPSDPNFFRCGRKVPYPTIAEAFAVAARLSQTSPDGKKICIYPCRWLHPGSYHIGHRERRRGELEAQLLAFKGKNIGLTGEVGKLKNQIAQCLEVKERWRLTTLAYRDAVAEYPRINTLLRMFGLQIGKIVEKEKS